MNTIAEQFKAAPQRVFDRLVDGELADQERRDVLAMLDDEPGAWRSCALAFLEAQSWRSDLTALEHDFVSPQPAAAKTLASRSFLSRSAGVGPLSMAACVLFSLAMGWQLALHFGSARRDSEVVTAPQEQIDGQLAGKDPISPEPSDLPTEAQPSEDDALQTVQLNLADARQGTSEAIELPVVEAEKFDASMLATQQSALSPQILQELYKSGHQVTQNGQLWPIRLQDGRELLVPVEQVEVQFAHAFQ